MYLLPNGCSCSDIKVTPSNWNRKGANTRTPWKIYYRFYDPTNTDKEGKELEYYVSIRSGLNEFTDLHHRRTVVKALIDQEWDKLKRQGFNPFTNTFLVPIEIEYEIDPGTSFVKALEKARLKLSVEQGTRDDIKYCLKAMAKAALQLRLDTCPINQVTRRNLKMILEHCERTNPKFSNATYNRYRAYLMMLFKELVELEAIGANPVRDISKRKVFKKLRVVATDHQRKRIDQHLEAVAPDFHKYVHLFFHSGGRGKELMQLKKNMVDLQRQVYKSVIRKGKMVREVERTIPSVALEYWRHFTDAATDNQYLFGVNFQPASKPMVPDTVGRWWNRLVKQDPLQGGLGINVDFYSLKHSNSSEIVEQLGDEAAAQQMGHTSTNMVRSVYDTKRGEREHEKLKKVKTKFA